MTAWKKKRPGARREGRGGQECRRLRTLGEAEADEVPLLGLVARHILQEEEHVLLLAAAVPVPIPIPVPVPVPIPGRARCESLE